MDPNVHKDLVRTVQKVGDVVYNAPGAPHQGIGVVSIQNWKFFIILRVYLHNIIGRSEFCIQYCFASLDDSVQ